MKLRHFALTTILVTASAGAAFADPPGRVGRLSYVDGTVSFHDSQATDWSEAQLNYPVTTGDAFWTEPGARSEIQAGGNELRMDESTEVDIDQLDDTGTHFTLPQGAVNIHVISPPLGGKIAIDTPAGEVDLTQPGSYHIDAGQPQGEQPSQQVEVTTLEGLVQLQGPRSTIQVKPGEMATITGGDQPSFNISEGNATPFDDWALSRESREQPKQALKYVSPHMTGYEDLDQYGQWGSDPDNGVVWYPTAVPVDWAPYRAGHWAYVYPWGWTWIDDAPWGFAPFHYGRWAQIHNRWCWVPGPVRVRPYYAPALVVFVNGHNWNLGIGLNRAPVGWVPLGPREAFHPYYHVSERYVQNVNITNVRIKININEHHDHYANERATTVISGDAFSHGRAVGRERINVKPEDLAREPMKPIAVSDFKPATEAKPSGHPLPASAREHLPPHDLSKKVEQQDRGHAAPINRLPSQPTVTHPQPVMTPPTQNSHTPGSPVTPRQRPTENPAAKDRPGENPVVENRHEPDRPVQVTRPLTTPQVVPTTERAPGPPIRQHEAAHEPVTPNTAPMMIETPKPTAPQVDRVPPAARPEVEKAPRATSYEHPQQQTQLAPTPKGWQRQDRQAQQPSRMPPEAIQQRDATPQQPDRSDNSGGRADRSDRSNNPGNDNSRH